MQKTITILLLLIFVALVGCSTDTPDPLPDNGDNGGDTPAETSIPLDFTISESSAGLTGRVISTVTEEPLENMEVWLANVVWNSDRTEGSYIIDGTASPTTRTRADGRFLFNDLKADDYVIVIGDLFGQSEVVSNDDGSARIYPAVLGQIEDAGTIRVDLDPIPPPATLEPYPDSDSSEIEEAPEAYP